ncbi:MAG: U32 family peptidase [Spirochaetales bacterium]|nr:U32 family peptidase [Spirochaetales bacterium]
MELLSPAGSIEKLKYAWLYGADAAYIGLQGFSLRAKADNFANQQAEAQKEADFIRSIKGDKKLYCALNIYFHNQDLARLEENLDNFAAYPFDAFIISDIGLLPLLKRRFPNTELHLSTQANATNGEAVKLYGDMGFSRVILGREVSLSEIETMKKAAPHIELEAFVHGAMCLAYSGRCFLSSWMTGRSGNDGSCAHSCRWDYRVLEEEQRPGEYYPVIENEGFTTIMSSKDICMIDHLKELRDAGVDSVKIEGRMKSIYYAAVVTRAYRKALDRLEGAEVPDFDGYREELNKVSHREFSTGFYFGKEDVEKSTEISYEREYTFMGSLGEEVEPGVFALDIKNKIRKDDVLEFIGPDELYLEDRDWTIYDVFGEVPEEADHGKIYTMRPGIKASEGYIIRKKK